MYWGEIMSSSSAPHGRPSITISMFGNIISSIHSIISISSILMSMLISISISNIVRITITSSNNMISSSTSIIRQAHVVDVAQELAANAQA